MKLSLYYDSRQPSAVWKRKLQLLKRVGDEKNVLYETIDTRGLKDEEREAIYFDEVIPWSMTTRHGIREKFIGPHRKGEHFGRKVPALLIFENDTLLEVYPRREGPRQASIEELLQNY